MRNQTKIVTHDLNGILYTYVLCIKYLLTIYRVVVWQLVSGDQKTRMLKKRRIASFDRTGALLRVSVRK